MNQQANLILSSVTNQTGVDSSLLLDDGSFRTRLINLVLNNTRPEQAIHELITWVNNNY